MRARILPITSVLFGVAAAVVATGAEAVEAPAATGLSWRWFPGEHRRFVIENEVTLPLHMQLAAEQNHELRSIGWQARTNLDCEMTGKEGRRTLISCDVVDIGLLIASHPNDRERPNNAKIIDEIDAKLTQATIQLQMRSDGRVVDMDIEGLDKDNRRVSQIAAQLHLVMQRSIAALDLQLPRGGESPEGVWAQYDAMLFGAPAEVGTHGGAEILHRVFEKRGEDVVLASLGRGVIAPSGRTTDSAANLFETRYEGAAVFDTKQGALTERVWTVLGTPTASSAIAEGTEGIPYGQRGKLRLLAPDEPWPAVGETREIQGYGEAPSTTLPGWVPLGATAPSGAGPRP